MRRPPSSCFSSWSAPCIRRLSSLSRALPVPWRPLRSVDHATVRIAPAIRSLLGARDSQQPTTVKRPSPRSTASIAPVVRIENTMIGIRFSRASANAVASITFRSRCDRLLVGQAVVALGLFVGLGVGAVDPVDIGRLQHGLGADLGRPQHRGGVGGKERIAGAGRPAGPCGPPRDAAAPAAARRFRRPPASPAPTWCAPLPLPARARVSSASAFMTVARMPIMSPVTRGMPCSETFTPRKILPPPTTMPTPTPSACVATRSAAIRSRVGWWMPKPSGPIRASPETFTTTRR